MDQASRKILLLKLWTRNSHPDLIGKWYFDHLRDVRTIPDKMRMDCGTETGSMAAAQCYLRSKKSELDDVTDCLTYGPSTGNQIEAWWRQLHERLEKYFKDGLKELLSVTRQAISTGQLWHSSYCP